MKCESHKALCETLRDQIAQQAIRIAELEAEVTAQRDARLNNEAELIRADSTIGELKADRDALRAALEWAAKLNTPTVTITATHVLVDDGARYYAHNCSGASIEAALIRAHLESEGR